MTFVTVHAGHLYVILRHQLFKFLSSDPRRREKLRGGNAGELEYSFLFEPAKAVGCFQSWQDVISILPVLAGIHPSARRVAHWGGTNVQIEGWKLPCFWLTWIFFGWESRKTRCFWKFCKVPAPPMAPFFQSQRLDGPYGGQFLFSREEREGSS